MFIYCSTIQLPDYKIKDYFMKLSTPSGKKKKKFPKTKLGEWIGPHAYLQGLNQPTNAYPTSIQNICTSSSDMTQAEFTHY